MAGVSIAPRLLLVGAVLGWLGPVGAREAETAPRPLPIADQSPTAAVHGLPRATGYTVVASGEWRAGLRLDYTSHYTEQSAPAETLLFDGETTRAYEWVSCDEYVAYAAEACASARLDANVSAHVP